MSISEKVELLRYKLLHQRFKWEYDLDIYHLLLSVLYGEVDRIDERTFSFKVTPQENSITAEQFLVYTNELLKCIKKNFNNICSLENIIKDIIVGNRNGLDNLYKCQCDDPYLCNDIDSNKKISECIYKIIIGNFIKNAEYVPQIESFLNENDLPLKKLEQYTLEESKKILKLLSDVVFSQRQRRYGLDLFKNIKDNLEEYLKFKSKSKSKKYTIEDFKEQYINTYIDSYLKIFKSFSVKKKYLKYFI